LCPILAEERVTTCVSVAEGAVEESESKKSNVATNILKETGLSVVENEEIQQLNKSAVGTDLDK
jgi:hypothetical protein